MPVEQLRRDVLIKQALGFDDAYWRRAARELNVRWKAIPPLEDMSNLEQLIRRQPMTERLLADKGPDFDELPPEGKRLKRTYVWPFQLHASIGPSCAVADYQPGHSRIWSGSQNPHMLRVHLSQLLDEDEAAALERVEGVEGEGRGFDVELGEHLGTSGGAKAANVDPVKRDVGASGRRNRVAGRVVAAERDHGKHGQHSGHRRRSRHLGNRQARHPVCV